MIVMVHNIIKCLVDNIVQTIITTTIFAITLYIGLLIQFHIIFSWKGIII